MIFQYSPIMCRIIAVNLPLAPRLRGRFFKGRKNNLSFASPSIRCPTLNQASEDRGILAKRLNISPHQLSYVTNSGEGEGLLFYGNVILPFIDRFPTDTELYRIMTTKLHEVVAEKEA